MRYYIADKEVAHRLNVENMRWHDKKWSYIVNGSDIAPLGSEEIEKLITSGDLKEISLEVAKTKMKEDKA